MPLEFSSNPGPHERQVQRRHANPLFRSGPITQAEVDAARERDATELDHFLRYFRELVQEAMELQPNTDSEVVLDIKSRLDQCYTHCCALPGEHSAIRHAVDKLIEVIMKAVRQGAANDPLALGKLDEEDMARRLHRQLQEHVLIADLLLPDSPIAEDELLPTLLGAQAAEFEAALGLFEPAQLQSLQQEAHALLAEREGQVPIPEPVRHNLQHLDAAVAPGATNHAD